MTTFLELVLCLSLSAPASRVSVPQRADTSSEAARSGNAHQLYEAGKYDEAARLYEILHRDFGAAKYLYSAAAAYEAANHDGHAVVALRRYLDLPGLDAASQAKAEDLLAPLRQRTTVVQFQIAPLPLPDGVELTLTRPGISPLRLNRETIELLDRHGHVELWLEKGDWTFETRAPGYTSAKSLHRIPSGSTAPISIKLAATTVTPTSITSPVFGTVILHVESKRKKLPKGLTVTIHEGGEKKMEPLSGPDSRWPLQRGTWNFGVGNRYFFAGPTPVSVIPGLDQKLNLHLNRTPISKLIVALAATSGANLAVSATLMGIGNLDGSSSKLLKTEQIGAGFLGAGVGFAWGTVSVLLEAKMRRPRILRAVNVSLGGLAAIVGTAMYAQERAILEHTHGDRTDYSKLTRLMWAGSGLIGLGVGILTSAMILRLVESYESKRTRRSTPSERSKSP